MFSFLLRRKKLTAATPLSQFVRSSSAQKKKAYEAALRKASDAQNEVVRRHKGREDDLTCRA